MKRPAVSLADDQFTVAAVGDCLSTSPISKISGVQSIAKLLRSADVVVGNLENTLVEVSKISTAPPAESGCTWAPAPPSLAEDLKRLGLTAVSRANNHATDFGVDGMQATNVVLDKLGIAYAGVGVDKAAARAPCYVDTAKGRIALISVASTFPQTARATAPFGQIPGRPGVNALRTSCYIHVTRDELKVLRKIRDEQPGAAVRVRPDEPANELELHGIRYKESDHRGFSYAMDSVDEREILDSIVAARQSSRFVIVSIHAHEPGNWSDHPADFLRKFAQRAIDAGSDAVIGHGPHQIRGIELYCGRPIFYSLGNFIFQLEFAKAAMSDLFGQFQKDIGLSGAQLRALLAAASFAGNLWYQGAIAIIRLQKWRMTEIQIRAVELRYNGGASERGVPRLALGATSESTIQRLDRLSEPLATRISIEHGVGIVRPRC